MSILLFLSVPFLLLAGPMVLHRNVAGFSISHPSDWTVTENEGGVNFDVSSADSTAKVQVIVKELGEVVSPQTFLEAMQESMEGAGPNLIPEAQRTPPAAQIQAANGDSGYMGAFRYTGTAVPVIQGVSVIMKGTVCFVLIQTIAETQKAVHGRVVGDIAKSFKITR